MKSDTSTSITIDSNTISNTGQGIRSENSDSLTILGNTIESSVFESVYFTNTINSLVYNNFFRNDYNAYDDGNNEWNTAYDCTTGIPNIIDGCCFGGNYWADFTLTGHSETCTDADLDGICDTSYSIPGGSSVDYYPLTYTDNDEDGVQDCRDKCLDSIIPEVYVPSDHYFVWNNINKAPSNLTCQGATETCPNELWLRPNHHAVTRGAEDPYYNIDPTYFQTNIGSINNPVIVNSKYSMIDTFGCTCEQILACKPGNNIGEHRWGCTGGPNDIDKKQGTMKIWTEQMAWALDCQVDGRVVITGEEKDIFTNTDGDNKVDEIDKDDDGDHLNDDGDSEEDSKAIMAGTYGTGIPDWWCLKHPNKCI